jgi:hypothetical protein
MGVLSVLLCYVVDKAEMSTEKRHKRKLESSQVIWMRRMNFLFQKFYESHLSGNITLYFQSWKPVSLRTRDHRTGRPAESPKKRIHSNFGK